MRAAPPSIGARIAAASDPQDIASLKVGALIGAAVWGQIVAWHYAPIIAAAIWGPF